jgi:hypothetical protein
MILIDLYGIRPGDYVMQTETVLVDYAPVWAGQLRT